MKDPQPRESLLIPQWQAPANVSCAFTLRAGGVSAPPFDSLNLGAHVGDDPSSVAENRRRVASLLALPAAPLWLNQVHGVEVRDADSRAPVPRSADAVVTRRSGVVCTIMVADCVPVLLAARDGSVIAAAHAGWRGLAAGVIERTVHAMAVPATQLLAWLGPSIGPAAFEVGDDVRDAFLAADPQAAQSFQANERGRWWCDLPALVRRRLQALGVTAICGGSWCTFSTPARFFSHRRDGRSGRMAALIWMNAPD